MSKLHKVKVNNEFEFEFTHDELEKADAYFTSSSQIHLVDKNQSVSFDVTQQNFLKKSYQLQLKSNTYQVEISNDLDVLISEMGLSLAAAAKVNEIKAPMPGLILSIQVKEGQVVAEGETVLILEAMKMENSITAPRDAIIEKIHIVQGTTVAKNELLIEMK